MWEGTNIHYQFIPYLWISLLLMFITLGLIIHALKNMSVTGARYFLLTLILVLAWIVAQAFELAATDLPTKILWANIQYIPIMLAPVTYLYLTMQYSRQDKLMKLRWLPIILLLAPVALNVLLWTDGIHGLIRQNVSLCFDGPFPTIAKTFGPLLWVFAVYNLSLIIFTLLILLKALREKTSLYRKQVVVLFIGLLLPVLSSWVHLLINPIPFDPTPLVFGLCGLIISWGIFRYKLFNVVPIARSIIIQEMNTGMIVFDTFGRLLDINPSAKKTLGVTSNAIIGQSIETVLGDFPDLIKIFREGTNSIGEMVTADNGTSYYYEVTFTELTDSHHRSIGWLLQTYNITERKIAEEIIIHAAFHDDLTGLPNRNYFQALFSQEIARAKIHGNTLAVAYLDLDDFKLINDTYGHDTGDRILCEVADRLRGALRESDVISRLGGDEFAILFPTIGKIEKMDIIGNKILTAFDDPVELNGKSLQIKASIGFSVFPRDGDNIEVLLQKADKAMYMIKDTTKNNFQIYKE